VGTYLKDGRKPRDTWLRSRLGRGKSKGKGSKSLYYKEILLKLVFLGIVKGRG